MKHREWRKSRFQTTTLIAVVVLLVFVFVSVGYLYFLPGEDREAAPQQGVTVDAAAQWSEMRPPAFRYEVITTASQGDSAPSSLLVTEDEEGESAIYKTNGEAPVATAQVPHEKIITIDRLFAMIATARPASARVEATFDPRFGFPALTRIQTGSGGWQQYEVRDFEVLRYE